MKITLFKGILYGVFGIAALIGLFVFATHSSNTKNSADTVGPILIWGTLPAGEMQNMFITLAQTNEAFKNVTYLEKSPTTLPRDLATAIATGAPPDLVLDSQENLLALSKFVMPLPASAISPAQFTGAFIGGASVYGTTDGYLGVPFLVDPIVLFANRSLLSSSGIARAPSTWEGIIGLVSKVVQLSSTQQVKRALIALGTYNNVHNARAILSTLFLQQAVPISVVTGNGLRADLGSSIEGTSPGVSVLSFYTQFADPSKISYTWNASLPDSLQTFQIGDSALYLGYASEARYLSQANPNLDFVVAPVPQADTTSSKGTYGLVYAFMIPKGAHNSAGAFNAVVLLSNPTSQAIAATNLGLAPASLTVLSTTPTDSVAGVAYSEALYTKTWLSPAPDDTDATFSAMIQNVTTGRATVETALALTERALNELLQK